MEELAAELAERLATGEGLHVWMEAYTRGFTVTKPKSPWNPCIIPRGMLVDPNFRFFAASG